MNPFPKTPQFEPPPPLPEPPPFPPGPPYRLRVWHFFLWTFASALIAAVTRRPEYMRELSPADERSYLILSSIYSLISGPFVAASLWFLLFAIPRRLFFHIWRRTSLGSQPGHWLLLIGGMETLGGLASLHLSMWRTTINNGADGFPNTGFIWILAYLSGLILTFFAWNRCTADKTLSWEWSILFWAGAAGRILCCFCNPWFMPLMLLSGRVATLRGAQTLPGEISVFIAIVGGLLIGTAVLSDRRGSQGRDAFHWLGVIATLAIFLYPFCWCLFLPLKI
jgi:hypothetical protein